MSPKGTDAFVRRAIRFLLSPAAQGVNEIIERGGGNLSINVASLSPLPNLAPSSFSIREREEETKARRFIRLAFPAAYIGLLYRIDMTALRVGRSKIISNAIVPPSGHHFPLPLEQTFPTVLCAVFAKFEGDILERSWKKKHLLVTICKFHYFSGTCFENNCIFGDEYKFSWKWNSGLV